MSTRSSFFRRRSRRALSGKRVGRAKLKRMLEAARWAPSCFNNQPWRFVVVDDKDSLARVHEALWDGNYWVRKAPVLIAPVTNRESGCNLKDGRDSYLFDLGLAVENLILAGVNEGLIVHPIIGFSPDGLRDALAIPPSHQVPFLVIVAYQGSLEGLSDKHKADERAARDRKPLDEIVFWNRWTAERTD